MYNIKANKTTTRIISAGPTKNSHPGYSHVDFQLLVEVDVKYDYSNSSVYQSRIAVRYHLLGDSANQPEHIDKHDFSAEYLSTPDGGHLRLTGSLIGGFVELSPEHIRGRYISTYLMNEIVNWAQQWPDAEVLTIELLKGQAQKNFAYNVERRNLFYERYQIEFDYDDDTKATGKSKLMKVRQLEIVKIENGYITEFKPASYISGLIGQVSSLTRDVAYQERRANQAQEEAAKQRPIAPVPTLPSKSTAIGYMILGAVIAVAIISLARF